MAELRQAKVDTYSINTCQARYNNVVADEEIVQLDQNMLCAGNQYTDTCKGKTNHRLHPPNSLFIQGIVVGHCSTMRDGLSTAGQFTELFPSDQQSVQAKTFLEYTLELRITLIGSKETFNCISASIWRNHVAVYNS